MRVPDDDTLKMKPGTGRRHEAVRTEVLEMHLFDARAPEEKALCGEDSSSIERRSVDYYLEDRLRGQSVGTVCERCKALAVPLAEIIVRHLEAEDPVDEAEDYRDQVGRLARETGLDLGTG